MDFKPLEKADKAVFDQFYRSRYYENAHFNFTNLYMWRRPYQIRWCVEDDVLYMLSEWDGVLSALQPIGPQEKMQEAIGKFLDYFAAQGKNLNFVGIEKSFAEDLRNYPDAAFEISEDRINFDYVYLAENLIKLAGRKFHSKKNHLNSFRKNHPDAEYLSITKDIIPQCREELNRWYELRRDSEDADNFMCYEVAAIHEVFDNFEDFKLRGAAIRLGGQVIAFTFGEQLNEDTAVIHVEKASPEINGAYAAINQFFVENDWAHMTYINREEDMGIEGLRKAKESYKPVKLIEKFTAVRRKS